MLVCEITTFLVTPPNEALARHVSFLKEIGENGKLFMAGKYRDNTGGLRIWYVGSLEEAQSLAKNDPYFKEGIG
ncbi:MAG: YciI family protein, partial [Nitrososphaerales archaeon]